MPWLEKTPVPSTFEEDREGSIHSSTLGDSSGSGDEEAREIKEVENAAQADTAIINRWRFVLAVVLLGTAAAVTGLAFSFLDAEQQDNFDAAVSLLRFLLINVVFPKGGIDLTTYTLFSALC